MNIFKLRYENKQEGVNDLKSKGVLVEVESINNNIELVYGQGVHSIVEIGLIVDKTATFDEEGNIITEPIYFYGYHYDIMSENIIIFESEIEVKNPKHNFAGYES